MKKLLLCAFALALLSAHALRAEESNFRMNRLFPVHDSHRQALLAATQKNDTKEIEKICRSALKTFPDDALWHYNLACALAIQNHPSDALTELEIAADKGFLYAEHFAGDDDLKSLRENPRFQKLLKRIRETPEIPPEGNGELCPAPVNGTSVTIASTNVLWNFEEHRFSAFVNFPEVTRDPADTNHFVRYSGPAGDLVRQWQKEGTAAGNYGDLYDNRDRGHSRISAGLFPELTSIKYPKDAIENNCDREVPVFSFIDKKLGGTLPTVGNASLAFTHGRSWRSLARFAMQAGVPIERANCAYLSNQIYVFPQHQDCRSGNFGDVFPAMTPYFFISNGSSGSDRPIVYAALLALAAMRPEVKAELIRTESVAPIMQMLIRASQKGLKKREDYLTPAAHPVVFSGDKIDLPRLVTLAHGMKLDSIPPIPAIFARRNIDSADGPGYDANETIFSTPFACAQVFRGTAKTHRYGLIAGVADKKPATFHWILLQGDKKKIRMTQENKITAGAALSLEIDWHDAPFTTSPDRGGKSSRVDIACIAERGGAFSPPAFFSVIFNPKERREYNPNGTISSIQYIGSATNVYFDSLIEPEKDWKDVYTYSDKNATAPLFLTREKDGQKERLTSDGRYRVILQDDLNRPQVVVPVKYHARNGKLTYEPREKKEEKFQCIYANDEDFVGEVVPLPETGDN